MNRPVVEIRRSGRCIGNVPVRQDNWERPLLPLKFTLQMHSEYENCFENAEPVPRRVHYEPLGSAPRPS